MNYDLNMDDFDSVDYDEYFDEYNALDLDEVEESEV